MIQSLKFFDGAIFFLKDIKKSHFRGQNNLYHLSFTTTTWIFATGILLKPYTIIICVHQSVPIKSVTF